MFKRFIKLLKYFYKFALSKKKWCWPRQSQVLILDATQQDILVEYLKRWDPEVLYLRGEQFNLPVLLASFFKRGSMEDAYVDCYIEKVSPRLIVTCIDNNLNFYRVSKRHPKIKTLFIQNGYRGYYLDVFELLDKSNQSFLRELKVDYMMVFGSDIGKKFSRYIAGDTVEMGSIKNNMVPREKLSRSGVIAFVSQWRQNVGVNMGGTFYSFEDLCTKPDGIVVKYLINYAKLKNKKLMIIPSRSASNDLRSKEEAYFRGLMGGEPEFLHSSGPNGSYKAIDSAEIVVSVDSTLGYESIARGNKTAIFCIRDSLLGVPGYSFGWPGDFSDEGIFWTNKPDPDSFVRILDYLFKVDDASWRKDVESIKFSSFMMYDLGNTILKSTLEKVLGAPPGVKF
jgi:surface carbohydrate biosynthesis protein